MAGALAQTIQIGQDAGASSGGAFTVAFATSNTAANRLLLSVVWRRYSGGPGPPSVSDSQGNTWVEVGRRDAGGFSSIIAYEVKSCAAGANTVTIAPNNSFVLNYALAEISGLDTAVACHAFDFNDHYNDGTGNLSITTTETCFLFAHYANSENAAGDSVTGWGSPLTDGTENGSAGGYTAYAISQASGTITANIVGTNTAQGALGLMAFKEGSGGGGGSPAVPWHLFFPQVA